MAVLPPRSSHALPAPFAELMTDPSSEIGDFYPTDFAIDINGKKFAWQAVVLLPFIDEERLLDALETREDELSDDEKRRNSHGVSYVFVGEEHALCGPISTLAPPDGTLTLAPEATGRGLGGAVTALLPEPVAVGASFAVPEFRGLEKESALVDFNNRAVCARYALPPWQKHVTKLLDGVVMPPDALGEHEGPTFGRFMPAKRGHSTPPPPRAWCTARSAVAATAAATDVTPSRTAARLWPTNLACSLSSPSAPPRASARLRRRRPPARRAAAGLLASKSTTTDARGARAPPAAAATAGPAAAALSEATRRRRATRHRNTGSQPGYGRGPPPGYGGGGQYGGPPPGYPQPGYGGYGGGGPGGGGGPHRGDNRGDGRYHPYARPPPPPPQHNGGGSYGGGPGGASSAASQLLRQQLHQAQPGGGGGYGGGMIGGYAGGGGGGGGGYGGPLPGGGGYGGPPPGGGYPGGGGYGAPPPPPRAAARRARRRRTGAPPSCCASRCAAAEALCAVGTCSVCACLNSTNIVYFSRAQSTPFPSSDSKSFLSLRTARQSPSSSSSASLSNHASSSTSPFHSSALGAAASAVAADGGGGAADGPAASAACGAAPPAASVVDSESMPSIFFSMAPRRSSSRSMLRSTESSAVSTRVARLRLRRRAAAAAREQLERGVLLGELPLPHRVRVLGVFEAVVRVLVDVARLLARPVGAGRFARLPRLHRRNFLVPRAGCVSGIELLCTSQGSSSAWHTADAARSHTGVRTGSQSAWAAPSARSKRWRRIAGGGVAAGGEESFRGRARLCDRSRALCHRRDRRSQLSSFTRDERWSVAGSP